MQNTLLLNIIYIFSLLAAAILLTSIFLSINTVFNVFSLIFVFIASSIMLLMLDLEFTAIVLTAVYVGAISVFFLFVLMTINLRFEDTLEYRDDISRDKLFSLTVLCFFSVFLQSLFYLEIKGVLSFIKLIDFYLGLKLMALNETPQNFLHFNDYFSSSYTERLPYKDFLVNEYAAYGSFELLSSSLALSLNNAIKLKYYADVNLIAKSLFGEMQVVFVVLTFILLFAMIAAVGFAIRSERS